MTRLLSATTTVPAERTMHEIAAILQKAGALAITTTYGGRGTPAGLGWVMHTRHGRMRFAMPVNVDAVYEVLTEQRVFVTDDDRRRAQAHRTAWRILREWVKLQLAIVATQMVDFEEVFLPYLMSGDQTLYRYLADSNFQPLLGSGE